MTHDHLPDARRELILDWVQTHKRASIESLAAHFGVSTMTIHRDVAELVKLGQVQKVHGGVALVERQAVAQTEGRCEMCAAPAQRMPFTIKRENGETHTACCPHCGLMILMGMSDVATALTTDFLYARTVSAKSAFYVVGAAVQICCVPSVLSFSCQDDAERFQRGFGGVVMGYDQALATAKHH